MHAQSQAPIITVVQARAMEEAALDLRLELLDGVVHAMGRASPWHAVMVGAIHTAIGKQLPSECRAANESLAVGISAEDPSFVHPDLSVTCGPFEYHPEEPSVVLNPRVVVEVLSPNTAVRDWTVKLPKYKSMASLHVIIYVEHAEQRFTFFLRTADGWEEVVRTGGRHGLRHLNVELDVDALYREATAAAGGPEG